MDELTARRMPYSNEAEQALLGAILIDPACLNDVLELISPDDFYLPENERIFRIIYSMYTLSESVDAVTVLDRLRREGVYDEAGGRNYLFQLMEITPTSANVREYAEIVRDKAQLRRLAEASGDILNECLTESSPASVMMELAEQRIYALRHDKGGRGLTHIKNVILENYRELNEYAEHGGKNRGVPTGFSELDFILTGLNNSNLVLCAARPSVGKTAFAINIGRNAAAKSGKDVAMFNLEMSREQLAMRLLASESVIDLRRLQTADLGDDEWVKLAEAANRLGSLPLYIDDTSSIGVAEIKARCRRLGDNLGLIVIDYLQLMQSGRRTDNRVQEVGEISRSLKIMAKELDVPVLCLSQLSRAPEQRADKRPMLSDLRDSGAIEQDADVVMFLYRDEYYNDDTEDRNICECSIAKNRHGQTGVVKFHWLGQYQRFTSQDTTHTMGV